MDDYKFECLKCGNCCRAGFEIVIHANGAKRWIQAKRTDFVKYIKLDPKCIAPEGLGGYHIEEENALDKIKEEFGEDQYDQKVKELIRFILETHIYLGEDVIPLPIYTIMPGMERRPILMPNSFLVMREGWKWGLVYIIKNETPGKCPFQEENLCSIHDIKPSDCQRFPYDKDGNLRADDYARKICNGLKKIS